MHVFHKKIIHPKGGLKNNVVFKFVCEKSQWSYFFKFARCLSIGQ